MPRAVIAEPERGSWFSMVPWSLGFWRAMFIPPPFLLGGEHAAGVAGAGTPVDKKTHGGFASLWADRLSIYSFVLHKHLRTDQDDTMNCRSDERWLNQRQ